MTGGSTSFPGPVPVRFNRVGQTLDYLAIGHLTIDRLPHGLTAGGSVSYASRTAVRLGLRTGVVTRADATLDWASFLPEVEIACSPSPVTSSFRNDYHDGRSIQRVLAEADPILVDAVPKEWLASHIVHLAPVLREVGEGLSGLFPEALVGLTPQGLLRDWHSTGVVSHGLWKGDDALLGRSRVVIFSDEDVEGDPPFLLRCLEMVPIVLVTQGERGAILHFQGRSTSFPAYPARAVDPTGAGDVFAASFLIEYHRTGDPYHSTAFACCSASFAVESVGLEGVPPSRGAVEERLARYQDR